MPSKYKNILVGYRNESQKYPGQYYIKFTNASGEPFTVEPGDTFFVNETPAERLIEYPKAPHYSKSEKIEE